MVQYSYDEGGAMSSYFVLTFLSLILIPLSLSYVGGESALSGTCAPTCQLTWTQSTSTSLAASASPAYNTGRT